MYTYMYIYIYIYDCLYDLTVVGVGRMTTCWRSYRGSRSRSTSRPTAEATPLRASQVSAGF